MDRVRGPLIDGPGPTSPSGSSPAPRSGPPALHSRTPSPSSTGGARLAQTRPRRPAWALSLAAAVALTACDPGGPCSDGPPEPPRARAAYVVHVSVDGLRPDALAGAAPAFARLRAEGAATDNARTDPDLRLTLPNHVGQLTGRPALGPDGHGWTYNGEPAPDETVHSNLGAYVPSVFDVVHDRGLRTAAYVGKAKFALLQRSYDAAHGAPDRTGPDDGRGKIDVFVHDEDTEALTARLLGDLQGAPAAYTFVHLRDPDVAGHAAGWDLADGSAYARAVARTDDVLGRVLDLVASDPRLRGRTALVVTSDHGGTGTGHAEARVEHYRVPFYVWGAGARPGDLYALNGRTRRDPGDRPAHPALPAVFNRDAAGVALDLLGLPAPACPAPAPLVTSARGA